MLHLMMTTQGLKCIVWSKQKGFNIVYMIAKPVNLVKLFKYRLYILLNSVGNTDMGIINTPQVSYTESLKRMSVFH